MKKIVGASVILIVELLIGTLFLVGLLNSRTENKEIAVIENNNLSKMAEEVTVMFNNDAVENDFLVSDEKENNTESVEEDLVNQEDIKVENTNNDISIEENNEVEETVSESNYVEEQVIEEVIQTYTGTLTGYGPDCYGCSGNTASGYYVGNTITYNDSVYGTVRIVAADRSIPFYSIVRISNVPGMDPFIAIVLDTGGGVGFGRSTLFDLLFASESAAMNTAYNVKFEILRWGGA